MIDAYYSILGV